MPDLAEKTPEADLPVEPVTSVHVEYGTDGVGRRTYRHVLATDWAVVPAP